jgi:hypothetical protein
MPLADKGLWANAQLTLGSQRPFAPKAAMVVWGQRPLEPEAFGTSGLWHQRPLAPVPKAFSVKGL